MSHELDGAWFKVERAHQHLEMLNCIIEAFEGAEPEPFTHRREFNRNRSDYIFYGIVRRQPPPLVSLLFSTDRLGIRPNRR